MTSPSMQQSLYFNYRLQCLSNMLLLRLSTGLFSQKGPLKLCHVGVSDCDVESCVIFPDFCRFKVCSELCWREISVIHSHQDFSCHHGRVNKVAHVRYGKPVQPVQNKSTSWSSTHMFPVANTVTLGLECAAQLLWSEGRVTPQRQTTIPALANT